MIFRVLAYKDLKLNCFSTPIFERDLSDQDIIESTRRMCSHPKFDKNMFDYDLYSLGRFDDKTGDFIECSVQFLVSLGDFRNLAESEKGESVCS